MSPSGATDVDFGRLLRTLRLQVGLTQEELADRSGVSVHAISNLEGGHRRPRLSSLARLADGLNLNPDDRRRLIAAASTPDGAAVPATAPKPSGFQRQLPADTRVFTGREPEVEWLVALAREASKADDGGRLDPVVVCAIDGMAGVGKSALAVHVAHRVADDFPDGQLFVDLRGHTAGLDPLTTEDGLDHLLRSLGVPPQQIPKDPAARAAFYRARLVGTRTLILLDNASSAAQVQPLLPGSAGCLVLVTSRKRLVGLDDAHPLTLDVLPEPDAVALLHKVAGPGRIRPDDPGIGELIRLCGNLPLAVRIVAAGLRHRPAVTVADAIQGLRDDASRLEHLSDGDRDLTAVFASSYATLPPSEQRLFRHLGLVPGQDVDAYGAAHLEAADHRDAQLLLESLLDHSLLLQGVPRRYTMHDLIRVYSRALSEQEPPVERDAAADRLFEYYQRTAESAARQLARFTFSGTPSPTAAPTPSPALPGPHQARTWLRTERSNLLAAINQAGTPQRRLALTAAVTPLLELDGPRPQEAALHRAAAEAAHAHGLRQDEADALWRLGRVHRQSGQFADAASTIQQAEALYRELGDRQGEANALWELGRTAYQEGNAAAALELYDRVLIKYRELGDRHGEANTLWELGRAKLLIGDYPAAARYHEPALAAYRELGDRQGEALVLSDLAHLRSALGDLADGAALLEQALAISLGLGDRQAEAGTLWLLARIRLAQGRYAVAVELLERALLLSRELGIRQGEASTLSALGEARLATGDPAAALALHEEAVAIFRAGANRHGEANALHSMAKTLRATGDDAAAAELLHQVLAVFESDDDPQAQAEVHHSLGLLTAEHGDTGTALAHHRRSLELARRIHSPLDEARALHAAARCLAAEDQQAAIADLREAVALYERTGAAETPEAKQLLATWQKAI